MKPFAESIDEFPPPSHAPRVVTIGALLLATVGGGFLASVMFLNQSSGTVADLRDEDALVLKSIDSAGVLVRDAMIECSFKPHVIVDVDWDAQSREYFVTGLQLHCVDFSTIAEPMSRLSKVITLIVPHATESERHSIAAANPHLQVVASRSGGG
jgi:hypothetical protein